MSFVRARDLFDCDTRTEVYETRFARFGILGMCAFWLRLRLTVLFTIWVFIYALSSIYFATQALIVGVRTYGKNDTNLLIVAEDHMKNSSGDFVGDVSKCETLIAIWMIVLGAIVLGSCCLMNCCIVYLRRSTYRPLFINISILAWLSYGAYLLHNPSALGTFCFPAQLDVFTLTVMFLFWGAITILFCAFVICFLSAPILCQPSHGNVDAESGFEIRTAEMSSTRSSHQQPNLTQQLSLM